MGQQRVVMRWAPCESRVLFKAELVASGFHSCPQADTASTVQCASIAARQRTPQKSCWSCLAQRHLGFPGTQGTSREVDAWYALYLREARRLVDEQMEPIAFIRPCSGQVF